jgi:hypothetical protein
MRFHIIRHITAERLASRVRPAFRSLLPPSSSENERFTLILFRVQHDLRSFNVILSAAVYKALAQLGDVEGERTLALGGDFTQEAKAALRENGVEPLGLRDFGWTDESYKRIKGPRLP